MAKDDTPEVAPDPTLDEQVEHNARTSLVPVQVTFDKPGDEFIGKLLAVDETEIQGNTRNRFTFDHPEQGRIVIMGGYMLDQIITPDLVGSVIGIKLVEVEPRRGGHNFKKYDIWKEADGLFQG